jgi:hypothetical protein
MSLTGEGRGDGARAGRPRWWHAFGVRSGRLWPASGGPGRQEATMTQKRKLSDEERERRRARDRERLKTAAEQLLISEGWKRWVAVRSRAGLARLSVVISRTGVIDRV